MNNEQLNELFFSVKNTLNEFSFKVKINGIKLN